MYICIYVVYMYIYVYMSFLFNVGFKIMSLCIDDIL